jgi:hypothetical protein
MLVDREQSDDNLDQYVAAQLGLMLLTSRVARFQGSRTDERASLVRAY